MASHFQAFSPSYENISNRMSRLRHSSQNHYKSYAPSQSPPKSIHMFALDSKPTFNHRPSPTMLNLKEETFTGGKFTGRVTKNVGLKKYNQRQIKEVMTNHTYKEAANQSSTGWTQSQERKSRLLTEGNNVRQFTDISNLHSKRDEVKVNDEDTWTGKAMNVFQSKLIPGKVYSRDYLLSVVHS